MTDTGFSRPTLTDLITRNEADINTRLDEGDSRVRRSVLAVLARINAGAAHGQYGYLDWIAKQVFPDTAEAENMDRWAAVWGIARNAATKAGGTATATGVNGTVIPDGTILQTAAGVQYETTAEATIASGTATLSIEALEAGDAGNAIAATGLTFVSAVAGADAIASSGELTGGADTETDASLLSRLLARIQTPPHGGADFDYEAWALAVPGVTRAWVYAQELGIGTVSVRFMMDDTYDDGIPLAGDVTAVQAYINARRPVTADVTVVAPTPVELDLTIDLGTTDTAAIRSAVEAEIIDMIRRDAEPGGTIYLSRINEAISIATGEFDHTLAAPVANVTHTTGQIAVMGDITWS